MKTMTTEPMIGVCFHCRAPCTEEDYCFGCKTLVCGQCSPYFDGPGGPGHEPEEHLLYFPSLEESEFTCRRVTGGFKDKPVLCGKPAVHSAYCLKHLHAVIDERVRARGPS